MGMRAELKLGAKRSGEVTAAQLVFHLNAGAYADISPKLTKAVAVDCSGPYLFPNLCCDCFGVYTTSPTPPPTGASATPSSASVWSG